MAAVGINNLEGTFVFCYSFEVVRYSIFEQPHKKMTEISGTGHGSGSSRVSTRIFY